ncbi:MAG TPA: hypothetical protein VH092_31490 [Urbifossiella sp.]|nr:hypothetical protein [Urbifossiella sp.]
MYFYGYPVAWRQVRQTVWGPALDGGQWDEVLLRMEKRYEPIEPLGANPAVPLLLLAVTVPLLLGCWVARAGGVIRPNSRLASPSWTRMAAAGIVAAAAGLTVALLDAVTTPSDSNVPEGICAVPFDREPGVWLESHSGPFEAELEFESGPATVTFSPRRDLPRGVQWLARQRAEVLPAEPTMHPDPFSHPDPDAIARAWSSRTRTTGWAVFVGFGVGVLLFRPWRTWRPNPPLP